MAQIIGYTESVCPQCLQRIKASRVVKEDGIYLEKVCPEHGAFSTLIWHGDAESYHRCGAGGSFAAAGGHRAGVPL